MKSFRVTSDTIGTEYQGGIRLKFDPLGNLNVPLDSQYDIFVYIEVTTKGNKKAYTKVNFYTDPCGTEIVKSKSIFYHNLTSTIQTGRHKAFKITDNIQKFFSSSISFDLCPIIEYQI